MTNNKKWYQSKSIWYAIITGVAGVVAALTTQYPDIAIFTAVNSVISIALRFVSDSSISS